MRNLLIVLTLAVLCISCTVEEEVYRYKTVCEKDTAEARHNFIVDCLRGANSKSDEEPEDWIMKCQTMAQNLYCEKKVVKVTQEGKWGGYVRFIKDEEVVDSLPED